MIIDWTGDDVLENIKLPSGDENFDKDLLDMDYDGIIDIIHQSRSEWQ